MTNFLTLVYLRALAPECALLAGWLLVRTLAKRNSTNERRIALVALALALLAVALTFESTPAEVLSRHLARDPVSDLAKLGVLIASFVALRAGAPAAATLGTTLALHLLASANDLIGWALACELVAATAVSGQRARAGAALAWLAAALLYGASGASELSALGQLLRPTAASLGWIGGLIAAALALALLVSARSATVARAAVVTATAATAVRFTFVVVLASATDAQAPARALLH